LSAAILGAGRTVGVPFELTGGRRRGKDDADARGLGQRHHRGDVRLDRGNRRRAGVTCYIVRSGHDVNGPGVQRKHVGRKAKQHLLRCLTGDSAIDPAIDVEAGIAVLPGFRDRIALEDHGPFALAQGGEPIIVGAVAAKVGPVGLGASR
jgi:hypothetical protein